MGRKWSWTVQISLVSTNCFGPVQFVLVRSKSFWTGPNHKNPEKSNMNLTKMIWTRPKQFGYDQNNLCLSKTIWMVQNHFGSTYRRTRHRTFSYYIHRKGLNEINLKSIRPRQLRRTVVIIKLIWNIWKLHDSTDSKVDTERFHGMTKLTKNQEWTKSTTLTKKISKSAPSTICWRADGQ